MNKDCAVGVPEITPVEVLNDKPADSAGLIDQLDAVPPVLVGLHDEMAVPAVYIFAAGL